MGFDPYKVREDFPLLKEYVEGRRLIYLDSAATSLKPVQVVEAMSRFYLECGANVHRGGYSLSRRATEMYEEARGEVAKFINAEAREVVFTSNATDSINYVAFGWGLANLEEGDEILVTAMEHHSNLLPWRKVARLTRAKLRCARVREDGRLDYEDLEGKVNERTRLIAVTHVSNALGVVNDIKRIARVAREHDSLLLVDGAQSVPHMPVDVKELGADFLAFSGHKMLGPMGIGVLYVREEVMEELEPYRLGGGAVREVRADEVEYEEGPHAFEAGTPNVAGAIGLAEAVRYLEGLGMDEVREHEVSLLEYTLKLFEEELGDEAVIYGPRDSKGSCGILAFNLRRVRYDILGGLLDSYGIAVRAGRLCAHPLLRALGTGGLVRISYYIYNVKEEVEYVVRALKEMAKASGGGGS